MDHHPDMPLKREHLLSWRINWNRKSENLRSLADELKLGLDSFILLDDDPLECAEVQASCPEVLTLQLPPEPHKIAKFLSHVWAFDQLKVTDEDGHRTALYRQSLQSARLQQESLTFTDFLASLNLEVDTSMAAPHQLARVAQLVERTNQFNFTGIRRTEGEIRRLCDAGSHRCLVTRVSDRFGDYGLVGAMIFAAGRDALDVDTCLLSCRVLGRGVEHRMLARLGAIALEHGLDWVAIRFIRTKKNQPALDFLNSIGALYREPLEDGFLFRLPAREVAALTLQTVVMEDESRAMRL
jgi:FkbH-like protein